MLQATSEGTRLVLNCQPQTCPPRSCHPPAGATRSTFITCITHLHKRNNHYVEDDSFLLSSFLLAFQHPSCRKSHFSCLNPFIRCNHFLYSDLCWSQDKYYLSFTSFVFCFYSRICKSLCAFWVPTDWKPARTRGSSVHVTSPLDPHRHMWIDLYVHAYAHIFGGWGGGGGRDKTKTKDPASEVGPWWSCSC